MFGNGHDWRHGSARERESRRERGGAVALQILWPKANVLFFQEYQTYTNLGMGAVVALLILDRAKGLIVAARAKSGEGDSGSKDPSYWKMTFSTIVNDSLDERVSPILKEQTEIMRKQNTLTERLVTLTEMHINGGAARGQGAGR